MLEFITRYWLEVLFGLMITGLGWGYRKLSRRVKQQDAVKFGMQALLRDRIIQAYNHYYVDKKYCPIYGQENVSKMFEQYSALGGNGVVKELVDRLAELPTEPPESIDKHEHKEELS